VSGEGGLEVEHAIGFHEGVIHHVVDPLAVELCGEGRVHGLEAYREIEAEDLAMVVARGGAATIEACNGEHYK